MQTYMVATHMDWSQTKNFTESLFPIVLSRNHCTPDTEWQHRDDGEPHDTVKPIAAHGFDLTKTVLIDDSPRKVLQGELDNSLVVPTLLRKTVRP
jgi:tryptophanyl-tRNA synthetase